MRDIIDHPLKSSKNTDELDSYFAQSKAWYMNMYIEPIYERAIMFLMFLLTFISTAVVLIGVYYGVPTQDRVRYLIKTPEQFDDHLNITTISSKGKLTSRVAAFKQILVENYVRMREGYVQDENRLELLRKFSTRSVFNRLLVDIEADHSQTSMNNEKVIAKNVQILGSKFKGPNYMIVNFNTTIVDQDDLMVDQKFGQAEIQFETENCDEDNITDNSNIVIMEYKTLLIDSK